MIFFANFILLFGGNRQIIVAKKKKNDLTQNIINIFLFQFKLDWAKFRFVGDGLKTELGAK